MATATTAPRPRMVERKEPELIQFGDGQVVEGILLSYRRTMIGDPKDADGPKKPVIALLIREDDGNRVKIHATHDILQKIDARDTGCRVSIRYEGEDHSIRRNGNSMKRFKVMVSEGTPPGPPAGAPSDGTEITDDDIPF
jgi:hypothetical protein